MVTFAGEAVCSCLKFSREMQSWFFRKNRFVYAGGSRYRYDRCVFPKTRFFHERWEIARRIDGAEESSASRK